MKTNSVVLGCSASLLAAALLLAGPLTPPPGPISSTYKTLAEVEPRVAINTINTPGDANAMAIIDSPGSYMLTADLVAVGGRSGIRIESDNVSIDLRGFSVNGAASPNTFGSGIYTSNSRRNISVRNGNVRNFGGYGITGPMTVAHFEDLSVSDNKLGQLEVFNASDSIAKNIRVRATSGEMNLQLGPNSLVEGCTIEGGFAGIFIASGTVTRCTVNGVAGVGIHCGSGLVSDCVVTGITNSGSFNNGSIVADGTVRIERCVVVNSVAAGVFLGGDCQVTDCTFKFCAKGVNASQFQSGKSRIEGNSFVSCTSAVSLDTAGHLVVSNRFSQNTTNINAVAGSTIGEVINLAGGGTLTAANSHALANIVH
ncbi:MAG: hypothetical protein JNM86_13655 [Phycisphaerae bacterium]|nr:hypothetical protein [Phycisphaerae bacterium]